MNETFAVKFVDGSNDRIEGWLAPYGGPEYLGGKDWHGEYFSPGTDFALDWFGDWERPLLYQHGLDDTIKTEVVGRISVTPKDKGLWMQAQLDASHEYHDEIAALVADGKLGASSGSVGHLVQRDRKTGEIKRWPLIEGSLTPTPANPDAVVGYAVKSVDAVAHLAIIGTAAPAAKFSEAASDASQAAYILSSILGLLGDEAEGGERFDLLKAAAGNIQAYIAAEIAEVGSPEDVLESSMNPYATKAGRRNSAADQARLQTIHDAVCALGATCTEADGEEDATALASKDEAAPTAPEPAAMFAIKASEPVANADTLERASREMSDLAIKVARELLRT